MWYHVSVCVEGAGVYMCKSECVSKKLTSLGAERGGKSGANCFLTAPNARHTHTHTHPQTHTLSPRLCLKGGAAGMSDCRLVIAEINDFHEFEIEIQT